MLLNYVFLEGVVLESSGNNNNMGQQPWLAFFGQRIKACDCVASLLSTTLI